MPHNDSSQSPPSAVLRAARTAPVLAQAEEKALAEQVKAGSREATDRLLVSHMRLVISIAQGYARHGVRLEDLISEGCLGLVEAARRFEPGRGTRFAVYAAWWIRACVRRHTIANRRIVRTPSTRSARKLLAQLRITQRRLIQQSGGPVPAETVAKELGVSIEDVETMEAVLAGWDVPTAAGDSEGYEVADHSPSPEERTAEAESAHLRKLDLERAMLELDGREREIVSRRYFDDDKTSLAAIAKSMGLSRERVRQLEHRARLKMRNVMQQQVA